MMTFNVFAKKVFDRLYRYLWANQTISSRYYCNQVRNRCSSKNIWLLGIPRSTNLGDQAQVMCSKQWFSDNYPDYKVFEFDSVQLMNDNCMLIECISENIKKDDIIFYQSGYNFTDMYPFQEEMHRAVAQRIPNNKIIFLPQTISFNQPYDKNKFVQESRSIYAYNDNVFILCRDKLSYKIAGEALPGIKLYPFPDIVTTLIGRVKFNNTDRNGVALCVRNDEEGIYSKADLDILKRDLTQIGKVDMFDTSLSNPSQFVIRRNREKYVMEMLEFIQKHSVMVTDRYHGLIFAVITNTPVVLLKTIDHKITEGLKWFPDEMSQYIKTADSMNQAAKIAVKLAKERPEMTNDFFNEKYYNHLRHIIEQNI